MALSKSSSDSQLRCNSNNKIMQWFEVIDRFPWEDDEERPYYVIECTEIAGDCQFACLSLFLNSFTRSNDYTSAIARFLVASEVNRENFGVIGSDIFIGEGDEKENFSMNDVRQAIMYNAWGCHSTLHLMLKCIKRLFKLDVGILIIDKFAQANNHRCLSLDDEHKRYNVILCYEKELHYQIIGDFHNDGQLRLLWDDIDARFI